MVEDRLNIAGEASLSEQLAALAQRVRDSEGCEWECREPLPPPRAELRSVELWRAVSAECVASFLYVVMVCGAAAGAGVGASTSSILLATSLASGCAIVTLTFCFANISGGHVNPAVSAALCVRRLVSPLRAALYVCAQCGGAIAGAAMLYGVTAPGYRGNLSASLSQWGAPAAWERFGVELVLTCVVVVAHCAAMERRWLGSAPLALGTAYSACSFVSMPYLNPARALGPSFVLSKWENHWVYWAGPLAGALAAGLLFEFARRRGPRSRASGAAASTASDDVFQHFGKPAPAPAPPQAHTLPSHRTLLASDAYCAAECGEPLYGGTKSMYCRSPPLTRANLHRSQSVYGKSAAVPAAGSLVPAQSLYPLPPLRSVLAQNSHNAQAAARHASAPREPAAARRPDSVYGSAPAGAGAAARRGPSLQSDDSTYGSCSYAPSRGPPSYRQY